MAFSRNRIEALARQALALRYLADSILHDCQDLLESDPNTPATATERKPNRPLDMARAAVEGEYDPLNPPRFGRAIPPVRPTPTTEGTSP